jgi:syntaxin 16
MSPGAFDEGDAIIEMDLLPPRWVDIQDEVVEKLREIAKKSAELDKLHQKHVLPGFDDDNVKKQEEVVIEKMTQEITRGFHECKRAIGHIETMVKEAKNNGSVNKGDETMARNIQISLAGRVQEVSAAFRKKQSTYLKSTYSVTISAKLIMLELRALDGINSPMERSFTPQNPYSDPSMLESETDKVFSQSAIQQSAQKRLNNNESVIAQREREINDIAKGIIELSDIFKDLQAMVIDQGTMLDRIDYNVERMAVDVKGADKELTVVSQSFKFLY